MSLMTGRDLFRGWLARIENGKVSTFFNFQFNPTETERTRSVEYDFSSPPGSPMPSATFRSINGDEISLQLLLDATGPYYDEREGVNSMIAELESYTQPDIARFMDDVGQFISPPQIRYGMGNDDWDVVVPSIRFRTVRWNREGYPTRAYADIDLKGIFTDIAALKNRLSRIDQLRGRVTFKGI